MEALLGDRDTEIGLLKEQLRHEPAPSTAPAVSTATLPLQHHLFPDTGVQSDHKDELQRGHVSSTRSSAELRTVSQDFSEGADEGVGMSLKCLAADAHHESLVGTALLLQRQVSVPATPSTF